MAATIKIREVVNRMVFFRARESERLSANLRSKAFRTRMTRIIRIAAAFFESASSVQSVFEAFGLFNDWSSAQLAPPPFKYFWKELRIELSGGHIDQIVIHIRK